VLFDEGEAVLPTQSALWRVCLGLTGVAALGAASLAVAQAPAHAGQYEQADIEQGAQLYSGHCVVCHGDNGDAMPGVNLGSGKFRRAETDRDLSALIRTGVAGTAMAPSAYNDAELSALVAYLRNMGTVNLADVKIGDPTRGRALFAGKGNCASCHRVGATGSRAAPDLSTIGTLRTAASLQRALVDPNGALLPMNRTVRVVLRDGAVVTGRRLNEDTFTVQLVDSEARLVSLDRRDIREYTVSTEPLMPSYATLLNDNERADLVAYLLSLKGPN
jgi:putative heme-binding domain-containing protein